MPESDRCEVEGCENPPYVIEEHTFTEDDPRLKECLKIIGGPVPRLRITLCRPHAYLFSEFSQAIKTVPLQVA
jgi:hypothetical protein